MRNFKITRKMDGKNPVYFVKESKRRIIYNFWGCRVGYERWWKTHGEVRNSGYWDEYNSGNYWHKYSFKNIKKVKKYIKEFCNGEKYSIENG